MAAEESAERAAPPVVLASASEVRATLLRNAGVAFAVDPATVDEAGVKEALRAEDADGAAAALALAELKAARVSERHPGALVVGADQLLECEGEWFDKPGSLERARADLLALRGRRHVQHTAVCVAVDRAVVWRHQARAGLVMRKFSERFLDAHLAAAGESVLASAGAYRLEGLGVQLFSDVEGDYFAILGLPLLPLLGFLREHGVVLA